VVSFTPRPLYPQYPFDRGLGGPQSQSGPRGEEKILYPTETRTPTPRFPARSQWSGRIDPEFLNTALHGGEWSVSHPGSFTPEEISANTHWIGGWVGCRASVDTVKKRKISYPCRGSNPFSQQPVTIPTALFRSPVIG
jgi:hypothetical protein